MYPHVHMHTHTLRFLLLCVCVYVKNQILEGKGSTKCRLCNRVTEPQIDFSIKLVWNWLDVQKQEKAE